ncbi:NADP(+)-dependent, decarboxylating phosphogluconate dehydrogenase [Fastidiosipila sanguinis]|uniref:6-phosphogluconate dehydrogenase, decarboxylating n=1 Tax=Fastidiosipila sanguinis TaxID=236753 RepID=A0A2S0KLT3_9FIRM|nr:NADP-dependent decarboxylating phosphogluconate dehydrogenase [Fastidiosipila sanguinis]AVM41995.1 phosphogluconate dehydrogenase (NADP(+)-dependent, decarboxylating) [Fastidiosipila sanguinis]
MSNNLCDIAVLGMAVMGKNLALNIADNDYKVAIYNRTTSKAIAAAEENPEQNLSVFVTLEELVANLKRPRKLLLMVKAGAAVDKLIESLLPLLDEDDIIMDGGNSHFQDTQRRFEELQQHDIQYLGVGVSGGEEGARRGPAIMPGGSKAAYDAVADIFEAISAKVNDNEACEAYMGSGGAGHYVKMVHNGIEYADMEIIAEIYSLLKANGYSNLEIADVFENWDRGDLSSYLSEITVDILREKDLENPEDDLLDDIESQVGAEYRAVGADNESEFLLDHILDISEQKGTGKWTNQEGLELHVDLSILYSGLNARYMSAEKTLRVQASEILPAGVDAENALGKPNIDIEELGNAFLLARLIAYAQGFALYKSASKAYGWDLDYKSIAATFRGGCIIRSKLLVPIMEAYDKNPDLDNLLLADNFEAAISQGITALRKLVSTASLAGVAIPAFSSALAYYDSLRAARSQANMISAQRDYFGAHTYRRTDRDGVYHHEWNDETAE